MQKYFDCPVCKKQYKGKEIANKIRKENSYVPITCENCGQKLSVDIRIDNKRFDVWRR